MFCTNCGKPVPDGSRFCPYCGTPVAGSADGLSYEDVLKKVNARKEEKIYPIFCSPEDDSLELRPFHDGERGKYVFDVDGCHFEYDERQVGFIRLAKAMTKEALSDKELKRIYWKNDSVEELLQFFTSEEAAEQIMGSVLKKESSLLLSRGIYGLTKDNLMARDMADGAPSALDAWQDFVQSLLGQVGKITGNAEAERTYRELRKEYRGRIIGGGFGLGGALQGMITAGVLNLASGAAHSIFNAIGNAFTNSREKRQLDDLFRSDDLVQSFIDTYRRSVFYLTMDASDRLNLIPPDPEKNELPEVMQTAINDGTLGKDERKKAAFYVLDRNPYKPLSYKLFYLYLNDRDGIVDRIAEAFGLSEKLEDVKFRMTKGVLGYFGKKRDLPLADLLDYIQDGCPLIDAFMSLGLLSQAGDIAGALHDVQMTFPYPLLDKLKQESEEIVILKGSSQETGDGTTIPSFHFYGVSDESITIPEGVTTISDYAFFCCEQLKELILPQSLKTIGHRAFFDVPCLKKLVIPPSVAAYPLSAVGEKTVVFLSEHTTVVNDEFYNIDVRLDIPLGGNVYEDMKSWGLLERNTSIFTHKNAIDRIKGSEHCELPIESRKLLPPISDVCYKESKQYPEVIHIPEDTEDEEDALPYTKLDTKALVYAPICYLHLTGDIREIGEWCFMKSTLLQFKAEEGLETIGAHAFEGLHFLDRVELPASLSHVGDGAFAHCRDLHFIELLQMDCHIGEDVFAGTDITVCCLPGSIWEAYCQKHAIPYFLKGEDSPVRQELKERQNLDDKRAWKHYDIYKESKTYTLYSYRSDFRDTVHTISNDMGIPILPGGGINPKDNKRIYVVKSQAEKNGDYDREAIVAAIRRRPEKPAYQSEDGMRDIIIHPWTMSFQKCIGEDAYMNSSLIYVYGGTNISYIGENAFAGSKIVAFYATKVKGIWARAFKGCSELSYVEVGDCLDSLEDEAFADCPNLKTIKFTGINHIGKDVFKNTPVTVICRRDSHVYEYCMENGIDVDTYSFDSDW